MPKPATSLTHTTLWTGNYKKSVLNCNLKFMPKEQRVTGDGKDQFETKVSIDISLASMNGAVWTGYVETSDLIDEMTVKSLNFYDDGTISAKWMEENNVEYTIRGKLGEKHTQKGKQDIEFELKATSDTYQFKGQIDLLKSEIRGECSTVSSPDDKFALELDLAECVPGSMTIIVGNNSDPEYKDIVVDLKTKQIKNAPGQEPDLLLNSEEANDQAELIFQIMRHDVQFLRLKNQSFVQAKLTAAADEEDTSNGIGVAETSMVLYNVDADREKAKDGTTKPANEPKDAKVVRFYLNQSYIKTQERSDTQMMHVFQSYVSLSGPKPRIFGAVLYDEFGNDDIKLNMFSADLNLLQFTSKGKPGKDFDQRKGSSLLKSLSSKVGSQLLDNIASATPGGTSLFDG